jgi:glycosyltransferase involved in cell wall biosynthesis
MKVLFDHAVPFALAHGGLQIQIEQTRIALEKIGVEVDYVRWWDQDQTGDVLHVFGSLPAHVIALAQQKGLRVVLAELLTEQGSRPWWRTKFQQAIRRLMQTALPRALSANLKWEAYRQANACVALTSWEAHLMTELFGARPENVHVVPNGVEAVFLEAAPAQRGPWLVCTATITERKRVVELAEAAVIAQTPIWIIGQPYSQTAAYTQRLVELARKHPEVVRYEGPLHDRAQLALAYRQARGFLLLSTMESLSLSALEAAACECPLLLSDLPWARTVFQEKASYCPITPSTTKTAEFLRQFYAAAPNLKTPPKPLPWSDVALQLKSLYESLLRR